MRTQDAFDFLDRAAKPEILGRLRQAARSLVPVVYPGPVEVDWAAPDAPYEGIMLHGDPPRIYLNPRSVLEYAPRSGAAIRQRFVDAFHALVLHEAGHIRYTSRRWSTLLKRSARKYACPDQPRIPDYVLVTLANLAEDRYVNESICRRYPGFAPLFEALNASAVDRAETPGTLSLAAMEWDRSADSTPLSALEWARMARSGLSVVILEFRQPGLIRASGHASLMSLIEIAQSLHEAGGLMGIKPRLAAVTLVAARFVALLPPRPEPDNPSPADETEDGEATAPHGGGDRETDDGAAERTEPPPSPRPFEYDPELTSKDIDWAGWEGGGLDSTDEEEFDPFDLPSSPLEVSPLSARLVPEDSLTETDAAAMRVWEAAQVIPDDGIVRPPDCLNTDGMRVYVVDSTPDNLPKYLPEYETVAAEILRQHRPLAARLRRHLRLRGMETERTRWGLTSGELDEDALPDTRTGARGIFLEREWEKRDGFSLTVLVDESGSMEGRERWRMAVASTVCLADALQQIPEAHLQVYGFTTTDDDRGRAVTTLFRHYDSRTLPRFHALGYAYPKHSNADGMALAALREILVREETAAGASRPYVLMISDGQPAASGYGGSSAFQHVAGCPSEIIST
jgi:hypothetical protein